MTSYRKIEAIREILTELPTYTVSEAYWAIRNKGLLKAWESPEFFDIRIALQRYQYNLDSIILLNRVGIVLQELETKKNEECIFENTILARGDNHGENL